MCVWPRIGVPALFGDHPLRSAGDGLFGRDWRVEGKAFQGSGRLRRDGAEWMVKVAGLMRGRSSHRRGAEMVAPGRARVE